MSDDGATRVGHDKADATDVYIGRGPDRRDLTETEIGARGWLGNPYVTIESGGDYTRAESIDLFREDFEARLRADGEFREAVADLSGSVLGCWCQHLSDDEPACHGEVIAEWADRLAASDDLRVAVEQVVATGDIHTVGEHEVRETDEGHKCVNCWEVRDSEDEFEQMECKSFSWKGKPSRSECVTDQDGGNDGE